MQIWRQMYICTWKETIVKALKNQKEIDELISANLNKWKLERINLVAHAIFFTNPIKNRSN